jgi:lysophospholipase L1-like esterase
MGVATALAVAVVVAGLSRPVAAAPATAPRVFVLGDSVLAGATPAVRWALADTWQATVASFVGLPTREGIQALRERQAELGEVVVVELGVNDWGVDPVAYGRLLDEAMAVLAGRHVVWLTAPRFRPEVDRINAAIRAAATRHADLEVLEWGAVSDAHPEATYSDRIHLRPAGQQLLAASIEATVDRWRCRMPLADAAGAVDRLYRAYFLREPDADGHAYWSGRVASGESCLVDVSEYFAASPELAGTYGALGIPEFVRLVYLNVLGREPDPDGYTYWADRLAAGALRRGELMLGFSESPEFRARR